jgi:ubiquinone biosynthesis protein
MIDPKWTPDPLIVENQKITIEPNHGGRIHRLRGILVLGRLLMFFLGILWMKLTRAYSHAKAGHRFAEFCRRSGLLWIKLGQFLSTRVDILPRPFCHELIWLQDRIHGFTQDQARETVEKDLGQPIEKVFSHFSEEPIAAASIAQVHKAHLRQENVTVAVKVRRPGIDKLFAADIRLIRLLLQIPQRLSIMTGLRWRDLLWEMEKAIGEELDYRYEISNLLRLRKTLNRHGIITPKLFRPYCGSDTITMEFVPGVSMADVLREERANPLRVHRWMKDNGIQREKLGKRLFRSYLRQVLEDNNFHADLHPGNIVLLRDNRIALLDFGSTGSIEGDSLRKYNAHLEALSEGQYAKAIDLYLLMMLDVPSANLAAMREDMLRVLSGWGTRGQIAEIPYRLKSTGYIANEFTRISAKYGVTIPWSFFRVIRGFTTMDVSLNSLIPDVDLPGLMRTYTRDRQKRELRGTLHELPMDALKLQNLIDYPVEYREMAIYKGAMVRRFAQVFEGATDRVSRLASNLFMILGGISTIFWAWLVSGFIDQHLGWTLPGLPFPNTYQFDVQPWILILMITGYLSTSFWLLMRRFLKAE